jgi:hypothetical protein
MMLKDLFGHPIETITEGGPLTAIFYVILILTYLLIYYLSLKKIKPFYTIYVPLLLVAGVVLAYVIFALSITVFFVVGLSIWGIGI